MNISLKEYISILNYLKFPNEDNLTDEAKRDPILIDRELTNGGVSYDFDLRHYCISLLNDESTHLFGITISKDEIDQNLGLELIGGTTYI